MWEGNYFTHLREVDNVAVGRGLLTHLREVDNVVVGRRGGGYLRT